MTVQMLSEGSSDGESEACICCAGSGVVPLYGTCPLCEDEASSTVQDASSSNAYTEQGLNAVARAIVAGLPKYQDPLLTVAVRQFPGKGVGLSAVCELQPGDLILAEPPLLTVHDRGCIHQDLIDQVGETASIRMLREASAKDERLCKAVNDALSGLDFDRQQEFWRLADSFQQYDNQKSSSGIFLTNAVGNDISRVYCWGSRFNHSCQPNALISLDGDVRHVIAASEISTGDEICIPYMDGTAFSAEMQSSIRAAAQLIEVDSELLLIGLLREQMHGKWGFWCSCARCEPLASQVQDVMQRWSEF